MIMGAYSKVVWEHFHEPKNVGRLENPDAEGFAGGRRAGPFMRFTARLNGNVVGEIKFQTYGCAPAIAAGSFLSEAIRGKTIDEARTWDLKGLLEGLGGLPEDKRHCAELAMAALENLLVELSRRREQKSENFVASPEGES